MTGAHTKRQGETARREVDRSPKNMLRTAPSNVVRAMTMFLCLAALWNWNSLEAGQRTWLLSFLLAIAIRTPHSGRNASNAITSSFANPAEFALFPLLLAVMVLPLAYLAGWMPGSTDYSLPEGFQVFGMALQLPYLWLFYRTHADLSRNWSPGLEIRDGHELVTQGIYRHIRHPMYAAVLVAAAAQPLLLQNWLAGPPVVAATIIFLLLRIPSEERMMISHFGADYVAYRALTGHILPRFSKRARLCE